MPSPIPGLDVNELTADQAATLRSPTSAPPQAPSPGWFSRTAGTLRDGVSNVRGAASSAVDKVMASPAVASLRNTSASVANNVANAPGVKTLRAAGPTLSRVAGPLAAVAPEAQDIYRVGASPNATALDVATQYGESAGKLGAMGAGGLLGTQLGTMAAPFTAGISVPVGGIAGAAAGYFAGDEAIKGLRGALGQDTRPVVDRVQTPVAQTAPPTTLRSNALPAGNSAAGPGQGNAAFDDPRRVDADPSRMSLGASRDFTNELASVPADLPAGLRQGVINKTVDANGRPVYSGQNVQAGAQMVDGTGRDLTQRGSVSSMPAGPTLASTAPGATPTMDANQLVPGGGMGGFTSSGNGNMRGRSDDQRRRDAETQSTSIMANTRANGQQALDDLGKKELATLREQGETTRANARNLTDARAATLRAQVEARGQDLTLAGHKYTADQTLLGNAARLRAEGFYKDREFNQQQSQQQRQNAAEATKRLTEEFASTLPPVDGKPDLERAARYAAGIHAQVSQRIGELQARLQRDPNDATAAQKLQALQTQGADAFTMDPEAKARYLAGQQLQDVVDSTATNGFTPWGTKAIKSNAPITTLTKLPSGDYKTNRVGVNGDEEIIPARYVEKEGSTLGLAAFGKDSNRYAALIRK